MILSFLDWSIVIAFFLVSLGIGIWAAKGNKNSKDFFNAGGNMPWWLLGVSMVATTFSADTPNLVTDIVRQHGVSGNWVWWAFLLTGMLTVFVYARLWKKSGIMTDIEFYELRYSGKSASFLRGFRAIYLGLIFNVLIMATVNLAAIKIFAVLLGLEPYQTILITGSITLVYSALGGLRGVILTDFIQFFLSLAGACIAAYFAINHEQVGGLSGLLNHDLVRDKLSLIPSISNTEIFMGMLLVPLLVQWWSVWYPGSEPGGGGYIAQRMLSAKDGDQAIKSVLFFNIAHYAIRPWPWIIVALASLIIYPDLASLSAAYPNISEVVQNDLAYSAMLTFIPSGLLGIVVTSLIAAYMSTISTHLNWGASYLTHDFYQRFFKPNADEKNLVKTGRWFTLVLMILSMLFALALTNALDAFKILLQIGAGTGLIFILRWFWWRVNAASEIAAMISSFSVALYFRFVHAPLGFSSLSSNSELIFGVAFTSIVWISTALLTKPASIKQLAVFVNRVQPGGPGWKSFYKIALENEIPLEPETGPWKVPVGILCMILGVIGVYSLLFSTGMAIYGRWLESVGLLLIAVFSGFFLSKQWKKLLD